MLQLGLVPENVNVKIQSSAAGPVACCSVWPATTFAQQETATIAGTVRDAWGAIVPGATVTVTNIQTNIAMKTQTGDDGGYVIPSLRPGDYSGSAESTGFQKTLRTSVTLQVAQVARVDIVLQAGQLTESVEVVGATPLLDTLTSSRGSVVDQKKIVDLPLNGRDYNQLALVAQCPARLRGWRASTSRACST
jgi:hypothetical protein